jgi:hypothetical protein
MALYPGSSRSLVFVIAFVAAISMRLPAAADGGEVTGSITMNGQTVELKHGYVATDNGNYIIYLTDVPAEYRRLDKLWTREDVNYVELKFRADGTHFGQDIRHVARGSTISGGGTEKIEFETFGPEIFAGRAYLPEPVEFFDSSYQYDVSFSLRLPPLEDLGGTVLPAGGGAAGEAYLAWNAAVTEGDLEALKELLPPEMAAELEGEDARDVLEFIQLMMPTEVTVVGGVLYGDEAELEIEGVMDGAKGRGDITMVKHGDFWIETSSKWRAGPIETAEPEPEPEPSEELLAERRYTTDLIGSLGAAVASFIVYQGVGCPGPTDGWVEVVEFADPLGAYLNETPTTDAWGHAILYRCDESTQSFQIASPGPDGELSEDADSDDIVMRNGSFALGEEFAGGGEFYLELKQRETARALVKAAEVIEAYLMEEMSYPEQSGGWIIFDSIAMTISDHPVLSKYPSYDYRKIPKQNAWGDSFLYWSDTQSFRLASIGPDRELDQDWIEDTDPSDPEGDDIVISDGLIVFIPEGVEPK